MRLSISNIAWDVEEDLAVAYLLQKYHIRSIDIAPSKYFPEPEKAGSDHIKAVRDWWHDRGIELVGMQALLFGTRGLNIFGSNDVQQQMLTHLTHICRIGGQIGASRLVFGSPKNRDRSGLTDAQALEIAISFFRQLGDIAQSEGVIICLEPNPSCYGANFMTSSNETAQVVTATAHPAIQMQFDTGAMLINQEDVVHVLSNYYSLIGHIHISEPQLIPIGDSSTPHSSIAAALEKYLPHLVATIEMVATKAEPHLVAIERALEAAKRYYASS